MYQEQSLEAQQEAVPESQNLPSLAPSRAQYLEHKLLYLHKKLKQSFGKDKIYIKKVRTKIGTELPNKNIPYKFVEVQLPQFEMPKQLEVTVHKDSHLKYDGQQKIALIKLQEFLNHIGEPKASVVQQSIKLQQTPYLVKKNLKLIRSANLWMYKGKRITNWHYDGHDNFLYQFEGTKTIYLLPPNTMKGLNGFSLYSNHALDPKQSYKFRKKMFKAVINKGQCLYIPRGWWHYVVSRGKMSKAVNVWGNSLAEINKQQYENIFKFLLFQISDSRCKQTINNFEYFTQADQAKLRSIQFQKFWSQRVFTSPQT